MSEVIELAKMLMHCPSITPVTAGVFDIIEAYLIPHGFTAQRMSFEEPGFERVENLYLRYGTAQPNFCFAGHTDVVPPGDNWTVPPFTPLVKDGELYGRGAEDMKGAIAAFCVAAKQFVTQEGWLASRPASREAAGVRASEGGASPPAKKLPGSISLLITQDEEGWAVNGTRKMLPWLKERGEVLTHCLVGEPTNPDRLGEMIKIGRRGSISFRLTVQGRQGHVAYPDRADNPVPRLVAMLHALEQAALDQGSEFFQPSNLEITTIDVGNPTYNVIPAAATAQLNVRFSDLHTGESVESWLRKQLEPFGPYDMQVRVTGESFLTSDMTLAKLVAGAAKQVTGLDPVFSTTGGTSDARFIKDYCPVAEFGTTGRTAHMVDERVAVKTLEDLALVYHAVLSGYFGQDNRDN